MFAFYTKLDCQWLLWYKSPIPCLPGRGYDKQIYSDLYHTKTILTNQIALFEGYHGSYFRPRHVPKIRTAFRIVQVSYITCW